MRGRNPRRSGNVEDRRGTRVPMKAVGGGEGLAVVAAVLPILLSTESELFMYGCEPSIRSH